MTPSTFLIMRVPFLSSDLARMNTHVIRHPLLLIIQVTQVEIKRKAKRSKLYIFLYYLIQVAVELDNLGHTRNLILWDGSTKGWCSSYALCLNCYQYLVLILILGWGSIRVSNGGGQLSFSSNRRKQSRYVRLSQRTILIFSNFDLFLRPSRTEAF